MLPDMVDEAGENNHVYAAWRIILPYCGKFGQATLRCTCTKWRDTVDAASSDYILPRSASLIPRGLLATRPLLTALTLTPTHLQHRPDLQPLASHLTSLTVRSNMRGAAWQRSGQGAVLLLLSRLAPLRRLQHLALGDCIVADGWDGLAALRRLRELDLGSILEVDNRMLTVLPLLSKLQALTLPGPEGYSPRYNQCSVQGFALCLQRLKTLAASSSSPPPTATSLQSTMLRRLPGLASSSCGNLPSLVELEQLAAPPPPPPPLDAVAAAALRGLTHLELRGLSYRRHGPEALRHSRPCPLADPTVLEALVESLPGLQVLALEEAGGSAGHIVKATASTSNHHTHRNHHATGGFLSPTIDPFISSVGNAAGLPHSADGASGTGCPAAMATGWVARVPRVGPDPVASPLLRQCLHLAPLIRLSRLTRLTLSAHVQLEYHDGEQRPPTGGRATAPVCDDLLLSWLQTPDERATLDANDNHDHDHDDAGCDALAGSLGQSAVLCRAASTESLLRVHTNSTGTAAGICNGPDAAAPDSNAVYGCGGSGGGSGGGAANGSVSPGWVSGNGVLWAPGPVLATAAGQPGPWAGLRELALREVWELGFAGLHAVCSSLPLLRCLDLCGSGRGLALADAVTALERLTGLQRLRLARATSCAWCLPDPFGGRLVDEDECARSCSEPCVYSFTAVPLWLQDGVQRLNPAVPALQTQGPTGRRPGEEPPPPPPPQRHQQQQQEASIAAGTPGDGVAAVVVCCAVKQSDSQAESSAALEGGAAAAAGAGAGAGSALGQLYGMYTRHAQKGGDGSYRHCVESDVSHSEEFYQDIDWDAFAEARHSAVADPEDDPWVSQPGSGSLNGPAAVCSLGSVSQPISTLTPTLRSISTALPALAPLADHLVQVQAYVRENRTSFERTTSRRSGSDAAAAMAAAAAAAAATVTVTARAAAGAGSGDGGGSGEGAAAAHGALLAEVGGGGGAVSVDVQPGDRARRSSGEAIQWLSDAPSRKALPSSFLHPSHSLSFPAAGQQREQQQQKEQQQEEKHHGDLAPPTQPAAPQPQPQPESGVPVGRMASGPWCILQPLPSSRASDHGVVGQDVQAGPGAGDGTEAEKEGWLEDRSGGSDGGVGTVATAVRRLAVAMPDLEELDLGAWPVTAMVIRQLAGPPQPQPLKAAGKPQPPLRLRRLGLSACHLDAAAVAALRCLRDLQYLDISSTRPQASLLRFLAALPGLEEVEVRGCRLYYESGKALQGLAAVKAVRGLGDVVGLGLTTELRGDHLLL